MSSTGFIELDEGTRICEVTQKAIKENVELQSQKKIFDLRLDTGPFRASYDHSGRYLYLAGQKGFYAQTDWKHGGLVCESSVQEEVRDIVALHNKKLFAVARKSFSYIISDQGVEVHRLRCQSTPLHLTFLPHHFLLASVNSSHRLSWVDITHGKEVINMKSIPSQALSLSMNPWNALISTTHANGLTCLWSPNSTDPVIKMLTHKGSCNTAVFSHDGKYMATAGSDSFYKLWDMRNSYEALVIKKTYKPIKNLAFSDTGLLALGTNAEVQIHKYTGDMTTPYLVHKMQRRTIHSLQFCPHEDVLGIGHDEGFSSIVVPGSGDPNIDSYFSNPYASKKLVKEHEVKQLLNKLQPETIVLDPTKIGSLAPKTRRLRTEDNQVKKLADIEVKNYNVRNKTLKQAKVKQTKHRESVRNYIEAVRQDDAKKTDEDFILEGRRVRHESTAEEVNKQRREDPLSRFK